MEQLMAMTAGKIRLSNIIFILLIYVLLSDFVVAPAPALERATLSSNITWRREVCICT